MKKKLVTCFGNGKGQPGEAYYDAMEETGRMLAANNCTIVTGGYNGSGMEAPAKGAYNYNGQGISYVLYDSVHTPHKYAGKLYVCGDKRTPWSEQFGMRLGKLLDSDAFVLDASGGIGTLVELTAFINLTVKRSNDKKMAVLCLYINNPLTAVLSQLIKLEIVPPKVVPNIKICRNPEEARDFIIG